LTGRETYRNQSLLFKALCAESLEEVKIKIPGLESSARWGYSNEFEGKTDGHATLQDFGAASKTVLMVPTPTKIFVE
jgi:hypothetical protein